MYVMSSCVSIVNQQRKEDWIINTLYEVFSLFFVCSFFLFLSIYLYVPWIRLILVFALNHSDKQKWPLYWTEWNGKPCLYTSKSENKEKKKICQKRQNEIEWVGKGRKKKINRRNKNRSQQKADKWSEEPM